MKRWAAMVSVVDWVVAIVPVVGLVVSIILWHSDVKNFLWTHPWWHSFLVGLPTVAMPFLAYFELRHSGEANRLRSELDTERNKHLGQIASNTEKAPTVAEKNAARLRQHIGATVPVTHRDNIKCGDLQIVEVDENNILTLFKRGIPSSPAWCRPADCGQVHIVGIPQGSCPIRLTVLEWYGAVVKLGEITKWEERLQVVSNPPFPKGGLAFGATYTKPGSTERRTMHVYAHKEGENSFLLESSTEAPFTGTNEEVSKRFLGRQVEYQAAGFGRTESRNPGGGAFPLFIC